MKLEDFCLECSTESATPQSVAHATAVCHHTGQTISPPTALPD
ncbi:hypothetical protein OCF10_22555 [Bacillus cereus]|nr:hypothetical protein [Bacillus cereus]